MSGPRGQRRPVYGPRVPSPAEVRIVSAALVAVLAVVLGMVWLAAAGHLGPPAGPQPWRETRPTFTPQTVAPAVPYTEETP